MTKHLKFGLLIFSICFSAFSQSEGLARGQTISDLGRCTSTDLNTELTEVIEILKWANKSIESAGAQVTREQKRSFIGNLKSALSHIEGLNFSCFSDDHLREVGLSVFDQIFRLRFDLDRDLKIWSEKALLDDSEVLELAQKMLRYSRYADEILGETLIALKIIDVSALNSRAFDLASQGSNASVQTLTRSDFDGAMDGDVILFRGDSAVSASIARITDNPSLWSHIGIVATEASSQGSSQKFIAEALIEKGLTATPWETAMHKGLSRAAIYRLRAFSGVAPLSNRESNKLKVCAKNASQHLLLRAQGSDRARPKKSDGFIAYNFSMDLFSPTNEDGTHDELFCSQAVFEAFQVSCSDNLPEFPRYPSKINPANRRFIESIGVNEKLTSTFAPADLQVDPHFELVAEWRDLRKTAEVRIQDLVLDVIYETMNKKNWHLWENGQVFFGTGLIRFLSRFPLFKGLIEAQAGGPVPPNISRQAMASILMVGATAKILSDQMIALNDESMSQAQSPRPLHPYQVRELLRSEIESSRTETLGPFFGRNPQH